MPSGARQYRDHLYSHRSHPATHAPSAPVSHSLGWVHLSVLPFLALEYFLQKNYPDLPTAIAFPVGFLFFWAFYYTYFRPGSLEHQLTEAKKWENTGILNVLLGSLIWFVKVTFVELTDTLLSRGLFGRKKPNPNLPPRPFSRAGVPPKLAKRPTVPALPPEILDALRVLGLGTTRDWTTIQKRYRELAKQTHPDLNPEHTSSGRAFMQIDAAYRRLLMVRPKYFSEKSVLR